jgi:hypothetical protein
MKKSSVIKTIFWKECTEARWGVYVGLILFLILPILETVGQFKHVCELWGQHGWDTYSLRSELLYVINYCGCAFAMVFGVAMVCHDMNRDDSPEPWRLLPIKSSTFITIKFLSGLFMLLFIWIIIVAFDALVTMSVEMIGTSGLKIALIHQIGRLGLSVMFLFFSLGVYAVSFMIACLIRQGVQSAILASTATLLICFLPMLVTALERLNIWDLGQKPLFWLLGMQIDIPEDADMKLSKFKVLDHWVVYNHSQTLFIITVMGLLILCVLLARTIIKQQWRLHFQGQQLAWFFVIVGLGLFTLAAQKVGNNLEPEKIIPLSKTHLVTNMLLDGEQGVVLTRQEIRNNYNWKTDMIPRRLRKLDLSAKTPCSVQDIDTGQIGFATPDPPQRIVWSPDRPDIAYVIEAKMSRENYQERVKSARLLVVKFTVDGVPEIYKTIPLAESFYNLRYDLSRPPDLYLEGSTLWLYHQDNITTTRMYLNRYDLSDPLNPISNGIYKINGYWAANFIPDHRRQSGEMKIRVPEVEGISQKEMLDLLKNLRVFWSPYFVTENNVITFDRDTGLEIYERKANTIKSVTTYQLASQIKRSPLTRYIGQDVSHWLLSDGYLYMIVRTPQSGVKVFDVRDANHPKAIGYYYAPAENLHAIASMGDGRVAVAGYNLHILNPQKW